MKALRYTTEDDDLQPEGFGRQTMNRTCNNCEWWNPLAPSTINDRFIGQCRVMPPTFHGENYDGHWPITDSHDWCGHFAHDDETKGG